jgi:hypothetical protein
LSHLCKVHAAQVTVVIQGLHTDISYVNMFAVVGGLLLVF